jgi:PAS domain S-box-containing protein
MKKVVRALNTYRLYFVIFFILSGIIIVVNLIVLNKVKNNMLRNASEDLGFIVKYKTDEISNWMKEREGDAFVVANTHNFPLELKYIVDHPGDKSAKSSVLEHFIPVRKFYNYDDILVVTPSGEIIVSLKLKAENVSPESKRFIDKIIHEKKVSFSDFYYCTYCKTIHFDFYSTFSGYKGNTSKPIGLIILRVNPNEFIYPLLQSWPVPSRSSETLIVKEDNGSVLYLNELRHKKNTALKLRMPVTSEKLPAAMSIRGIEGSVTGIDYRGKEVLAWIQRVPNTPWNMIGKTDLDEVLAPMGLWKVYSALASVILILMTGFSIMMIIFQQRRDHYRRLYEIELGTLEKTREAARAIQESEERFRKIFDESPIGIGIARHGFHVYVNPAFVRLFGYRKPEEIVGTSIVTVIAPDEGEQILDQNRKREGNLYAPESYEITGRKHDGKIFPMHVEATTIQLADGVATMAFFQDLSDQKRAEKELMQSERRYRMLFTSMLEGFALHEVVYDPEGRPVDYRFLEINDSFEKLTGLKASEIRGKLVSEILPNLEGAWYDTYFAVARTGIPVSFELFNQDLDKYFQVHAFRPDTGQFATTFTDITAARKIQEEIKRLNLELEERVRQRTAQLEASNRELESFSYSVSHDLRAPLRSLDGFSQALMEDYLSIIDEKGKVYLQRIRAASQKMATLIDDLLKLSRVSRQSMNFHMVDLSVIVHDLCNDLQKEHPGYPILFKIRDGVQASVDPQLLKIALGNLLDNAVKFSSRTSNPEIVFGVDRKNDRDVIYIKDNGSGFDMKYIGKLFGAFQRLHSNEEFPGTGIGLTIVQRIINRHNGSIWAESEPGKGATFYFTLQSLIF